MPKTFLSSAHPKKIIEYFNNRGYKRSLYKNIIYFPKHKKFFIIFQSETRSKKGYDLLRKKS